MIINQLNYDFKVNSSPLFTTKPSETKPDDTLTMQELIDRYVKTSEISGNAAAFGFDTDETVDFPEIAKMDKLDRLRIADELKDSIEQSTLKVTDLRSKIKIRKENLKKLKELKEREAIQKKDEETKPKPTELVKKTPVLVRTGTGDTANFYLLKEPTPNKTLVYYLADDNKVLSKLGIHKKTLYIAYITK